MKKFNEFVLNNVELIYGGELENTYVGRNGDLYDTETERYIFFE